MTREGFAKLVHDNCLFDMAKLFDLCVLYEHNPVLEKLVENLLDAASPHREKFYESFERCVRDNILKAIETSKKKLEDMFELANVNIVVRQRLSEKLQNRFKEIFELIYYLIDLFKTLNSVVNVHPKFIRLLFDVHFEKK